jgi:hypothetical protein
MPREMSIFERQIAGERLASVQNGCDTASRNEGFMVRAVNQR